jgi:adenine deaminase
MENILGEAKSYLEEQGIDTTNMTEEEIIIKYYELLESKLEEVEEAVEEPAQEIDEEAVGEEVADEEVVEAEEVSGIESLIAENAEVINSLNEEQKALFEKLIAMIN